MNIITVDSNKTLNKNQIYDLLKFLFLFGVSIHSEFNSDGKATYFIKHSQKEVQAESIEKCLRLFIKEITMPDYQFLSNNVKRKLERIMRWRIKK